MIKLLSTAACIALLLSCNNSGDGNAEATPDSPETQYRGTFNANGNIPDTVATGAEPNSNLHTDSAK